MHRVFSGIEFILRGGFMMIPLLISAFFALTVILERIYILGKVYHTPPEWIEKVFAKIKSNRFNDAQKLCTHSHTPIAAILSAGIEHFDNPIEEMELSMKNQAEAWVPLLEKRIEVIDTVITAAPLMGLLGTITGMMASFQVLSEKGVNEPNAITGGVAEALIATATGLVIALFCLVAYNYLTAKIKNAIYDIESIASRVVEIRLATHRTRNAQQNATL
jgi:biopolymer transport protein ExbB